MADPKKASAEKLVAACPGRAFPRLGDRVGIASDARPLLALLSLVATALIRGVYVITTRLGDGPLCVRVSVVLRGRGCLRARLVCSDPLAG